MDQPVTDRNKSAYKLKNFGPVYCINLDGQPERWEYMKNQFKYWNFKWSDLYAYLPYDYDVVQLAIICTGDIHVRLHKRFVNDFSTACYIISRYHAEKLVRLHCRGDKYKLDQGVKPRPVADDLIYNSGNSFAIPLLVYKFELGSSIHPVHVDAYHKQNYEAQVNFWTQNGANIDIKDYMNYDPYLGRVTESSAQQQ